MTNKDNISKLIIVAVDSKFKQFDYVDQIENIQKDVLRSKMILGSSSPRLEYYYKLLKHSRYKKKIIKLIKENILEE